MTGLELLASLVMEDGLPWAETAADYQWEDARSILEPGEGPRQVFLTRPRGGRKTTDLAGIVLAVLATQAPAASRCYVGASDEDQAQELIDAAEQIVARTPGLAGSFRVTGFEITYVPTGSTVTALPADASAMGKRAYLIVLDELANWPDTRKHRKFWDVLTSGNRKLADCRTVVITNSGSPDHWSYKRLEVARNSPRWVLREVPGPLPWLTEDDLEALRENTTVPSEFDRLHLNVWVQPEDRLASRDDVLACVRVQGRQDLEPQPKTVYAAGLDLGVKHDRTALVVAHLELVGAQKRVVVDSLRVWTPSKGKPVDLQDVEDTVAAACELYGASLLFDPSQALLIGQRLRDRGLKAQEESFTLTSNSYRAGLMYRLVRERLLDLPDDDDLVDELASVRLLEGASGLFRLDHDSGRHDDRVQAVALAAQHLLTHLAHTRKLRFRTTSATPQYDSPTRRRLPEAEARQAREAARAAAWEDFSSRSSLRTPGTEGVEDWLAQP